METETNTLNHSLGTVLKLAQDRQKWRSVVAALHASWHNRQKVVGLHKYIIETKTPESPTKLKLKHFKFVAKN